MIVRKVVCVCKREAGVKGKAARGRHYVVGVSSKAGRPKIAPSSNFMEELLDCRRKGGTRYESMPRALLGLLSRLLGSRSSVLAVGGRSRLLDLLAGDVVVVDTHGLVDLVAESRLVGGTVKRSVRHAPCTSSNQPVGMTYSSSNSALSISRSIPVILPASSGCCSWILG